MGAESQGIPPPEGTPEPTGARRNRRLAMRALRAAAVGLVVALLGLLIWDMVATSSGASFVSQIQHGKKPLAPQFALPVVWDQHATWPATLQPRLADNRITLSELRGFPVVVNFWASWCVPCREEAPAFRNVAAHYAGRVAFLGIDIQDLKSSGRQFLSRYKVDYVSVRDSSNSVYIAYGLTGVPETFFVDRRGRAILHSIGGVSQAQLEQNVQTLLKENP